MEKPRETVQRLCLSLTLIDVPYVIQHTDICGAKHPGTITTAYAKKCVSSGLTMRFPKKLIFIAARRLKIAKHQGRN